MSNANTIVVIDAPLKEQKIITEYLAESEWRSKFVPTIEEALTHQDKVDAVILYLGTQTDEIRKLDSIQTKLTRRVILSPSRAKRFTFPKELLLREGIQVLSRPFERSELITALKYPTTASINIEPPSEEKSTPDKSSSLNQAILPHVELQLKLRSTTLARTFNSDILVNGTKADRERVIADLLLEVQELGELADDTHVINRACDEEYKLENCPLDLQDLLTSLNGKYQEKVKASGIEFSINLKGTLPKNISTDRSLLKHVIRTMLKDALQAKHQKRIILSVEAECERKIINFTVHDTRIEVPNKSSSSRSNYPNWVSLLVRKLGGDLNLQSLPMVGMSAHFTLPLSTFSLNDSFSNLLPLEVKTPLPPTPVQVIPPPKREPSAIPAPKKNASKEVSELGEHMTEFLKSVLEECANMKSALDQQDWKHISYLANQLRGTASLYALSELADELLSIESAAKISDGSVIQNRLEDVGKLAERCLSDGTMTDSLDTITQGIVLRSFSKPPENPAAIRSTLVDSSPELLPLITEFVDSLDGYLNKITLSVNQLAWESLQAVSHELAGVASMYGYPDCAKAAKKLQHAAESKEAKELPSIVSELSTLSQGVKMGRPA